MSESPESGVFLLSSRLFWFGFTVGGGGHETTQHSELSSVFSSNACLRNRQLKHRPHLFLFMIKEKGKRRSCLDE